MLAVPADHNVSVTGERCLNLNCTFNNKHQKPSLLADFASSVSDLIVFFLCQQVVECFVDRFVVVVLD